jgi:2-amino-4-hydroxy-6-hydroxymethyldihydropteridine diphosphokinase
MKSVIALGSNLGNRELNIDSAVAELAKIIEITHLSTNYETDPVGGPDQPKYLNAVLLAETQMDPHDLLIAMLEIENRLGRTRELHWGPRTIDLDLITCGDLVISSKVLELPHPRAHERRFVLEPWLEIDSDAQIPGHGLVATILQGMQEDL